MDNIFSVSIGLSLRLLFHVASQHNRLGPPLIGLWEGVVLYHISNKSPSSVDPYIAYGLRLLVDFLFTESVSRMTIVLLWTTLGMLVSEALGPGHWYDTSHERRSKPRRTRSIPHIQNIAGSSRLFHSTSQVSQMHNPALTLSGARPATLPSPPHQTRSHPTSVLDRRPETYSPPRLIHLPTPPETSVPDGFDHGGNNPSSERQSVPDCAHPDSIIVLGSDTVLDDLVVHTPDDPNAIDHPTYTLAPPVVLDPDVLECNSQPATGHNQSDHVGTPTLHPQQLSPIYPDVHSLPEFAAATIDMGPSKISTNSETVDDPSSSTLIDKPIVPVPRDVSNEHAIAVPDYDNISAVEAASVISTSSRDGLNSRAEIFRQQARAEEKERSRLENELKKASSEGRIKDAFLLRGHIKTAEERATKLHERAARRYFLANNLLQRPQTIDVHRLRVNEAIRVTEKAFRDVLVNGQSSLRVIVGKGNHSRGGFPVLKGALIREMEKQKLPHMMERGNPGVLIITLPP